MQSGASCPRRVKVSRLIGHLHIILFSPQKTTSLFFKISVSLFLIFLLRDQPADFSIILVTHRGNRCCLLHLRSNRALDDVIAG